MVINEVFCEVALTDEVSTLKGRFEGRPDLLMLCIIERMACSSLFSVYHSHTITASEHFTKYLNS
jgi:hypothetical protein